MPPAAWEPVETLRLEPVLEVLPGPARAPALVLASWTELREVQ